MQCNADNDMGRDGPAINIIDRVQVHGADYSVRYTPSSLFTLAGSVYTTGSISLAVTGAVPINSVVTTEFSGGGSALLVYTSTCLLERCQKRY